MSFKSENKVNLCIFVLVESTFCLISGTGLFYKVQTDFKSLSSKRDCSPKGGSNRPTRFLKHQVVTKVMIDSFIARVSLSLNVLEKCTVFKCTGDCSGESPS